MEDLRLSDERLHEIAEFLYAKKYPYNTIRQYGSTLQQIWKKYDVLNQEVANKLLKKFKHQNQRAVLTLINRFCEFKGIDFRILLPRLTRQKQKITIKTLPQSEINIMIKSVPKPYDLMLKCIFNIGGGLRVSESLRLCWYHFFWANWLENGGLGAVLIKDSKGDDRILPLKNDLMKELYELAKEQRVLNEHGIPDGDLIFKLGKGFDYKPELQALDIERWKAEYLRYAYDQFRHQILKKHCEKALGHPVRIHSLRHSKATDLLDKGVPLEVIQKLLGHREITTTMIYTQVSDKKTFDWYRRATQ